MGSIGILGNPYPGGVGVGTGLASLSDKVRTPLCQSMFGEIDIFMCALANVVAVNCILWFVCVHLCGGGVRGCGGSVRLLCFCLLVG